MNNKEFLIDYPSLYNQAIKEYKKLDDKLKSYPSWIIDYHLYPRGENVTSVFLEMKGLHEVDLENGKPLLLVEWLQGGYYSEHLEEDNNRLINEYMGYLEDYKTTVEHENKLTDYTLEPIASDGYIAIYDVIHGIEDKVIVGRDFKESQPYMVHYEDDGDYFMIGDNKLYLDDFIRTNY